MNAKLAIWVILGVSLTCSTMLDASASEVVPFTRGVLASGAYVPPSVFVDSNLLPFYSLYPPVYYSRPISHSYGSTPFAWGPCANGPDAYYSGGPAFVRAPAVVRNTHIGSMGAIAPVTCPSAPKPLRIVNRHASSKKTHSVAAEATDARQPVVIHPTALARLSE